MCIKLLCLIDSFLRSTSEITTSKIKRYILPERPTKKTKRKHSNSGNNLFTHSVEKYINIFFSRQVVIAGREKAKEEEDAFVTITHQPCDDRVCFSKLYIMGVGNTFYGKREKKMIFVKC